MAYGNVVSITIQTQTGEEITIYPDRMIWVYDKNRKTVTAKQAVQAIMVEGAEDNERTKGK